MNTPEPNKTLTAYCFLAALTENENDLYSHVYIPICKRALSRYSEFGKTHGTNSDIQSVIAELYGLNVPLLIVSQLIKGLEKSFSRNEKEKNGFKIFENGNSFEVKKFGFSLLEEAYNAGRRNANTLQLAFDEYISDNGLGVNDVPLFADFIDRYRHRLSSFFKGAGSLNCDDIDKSYLYHVNFLEYIETHQHELYKTAENIFLGSLVASYLESGLNLEPKFTTDEVYYLDTQIILKAIDLQNQEDTQSIKELIEIIKGSGASVKALDITIDELCHTIEVALNYYNADNPTTTINEACKRKSKNKVWLINLNGNIEEYLKNELGLSIEKIPLEKKEKYKKSDDLKLLKEQRWKEANAIHDVFAYLFVRDKREGNVQTFQKAKYWFVTANKNLCQFNISRHISGSTSETILPDSLAGLLWLKNPIKFKDKIKSIGLNVIIAQTVREEIASRELINAFDGNLKQYSQVSDSEYGVLLSAVANQSAKNIQRINDLAEVGKKEEYNV
jgi:predicted nucleic acid-binding protein